MIYFIDLKLIIQLMSINCFGNQFCFFFNDDTFLVFNGFDAQYPIPSKPVKLKFPGNYLKTE